MDVIEIQCVTFKRPNSNVLEKGIIIGEFGRHIIIDKDLNIVINCSLESYECNKIEFNLNFKT